MDKIQMIILIVSKINRKLMHGIYLEMVKKQQFNKRLIELNTHIRVIKKEEAQELLNFYSNIKFEEGPYNPNHFPFKVLADFQKKYNSESQITMDYAVDYNELAMYQL